VPWKDPRSISFAAKGRTRAGVGRTTPEGRVVPIGATVLSR